HKAQPEPRVFPLRIAIQQLHIQPFGFIFLTLLLQHAREVIEHVSQVWRNLQRLLVGLTRAREVSTFLANDAHVPMSLLRIQTDRDRFRIGLAGFEFAPALLLGDAQIEPALEVVRRELSELRAVTSRRFEILRLESASGEPFQSSLRERTQLQQTLRILL